MTKRILAALLLVLAVIGGVAVAGISTSSPAAAAAPVQAAPPATQASPDPKNDKNNCAGCGSDAGTPASPKAAPASPKASPAPVRTREAAPAVDCRSLGKERDTRTGKCYTPAASAPRAVPAERPVQAAVAPRPAAPKSLSCKPGEEARGLVNGKAVGKTVLLKDAKVGVHGCAKKRIAAAAVTPCLTPAEIAKLEKAAKAKGVTETKMALEPTIAAQAAEIESLKNQLGNRSEASLGSDGPSLLTLLALMAGALLVGSFWGRGRGTKNTAPAGPSLRQRFSGFRNPQPVTPATTSTTGGTTV